MAAWDNVMKYFSALMTVLFISFSILGLSACGCGDDDDDRGESSGDDDTADNDDDDLQGGLISYTRVVPSDGLPDSIELKNANNNLDVVRHEGRVFLAFRTARNHFADKNAIVHVVSSADEQSWDFESSFTMGTDLREPRLLSFDGMLFLYISLLGENALDFEPQGLVVTQYNGPEDWTETQNILDDNFIAWRTKTIDGVPYMLAYTGGESVYDPEGGAMEVHWLTTEDGYEWEPVVPGQPVVMEGGCSETDFEFLDNGDLVAVCRNEKGDEDGWGSKICRAPANDLGAWECVPDKKKYDSPLVFKHNSEIYLIGRRNLNINGHYDLGWNHLPEAIRFLMYELDYWTHQKRTTLWRVDPTALSVKFIVDLPSRGDTCFPGLIKLDDSSYAVYNYSSPLTGPDLIWVKGQLGPTYIYRSVLDFE